MSRAESSSTRLGSFAESAAAPIATPCCSKRLAIVAMSAKSGRLASTSGSAVSRLAAINGSAAFLAPPILIAPDSGTPPRIRMLSIMLLRVAGAGRNEATAPPTLDRNGCFYGRAEPRSSAGLAGRLSILRWLAGACLLLAATQVLAQGPGKAFVARRRFVAPSRGNIGTIAHRGDGRAGRGRCQPSSTRSETLAAIITATACRAAYSAAWSGWLRRHAATPARYHSTDDRLSRCAASKASSTASAAMSLVGSVIELRHAIAGFLRRFTGRGGSCIASAATLSRPDLRRRKGRGALA